MITDALLAHINALPAPDGARLDDVTRAALAPMVLATGMALDEAGINGVALEALMAGAGTLSPERRELLLAAYAQHGYDAPDGATSADLLAMMDAVAASDLGSPAADNRTAYGIALALKAGQPEVATTLADGPDGGIGWALTRAALGEQTS